MYRGHEARVGMFGDLSMRRKSALLAALLAGFLLPVGAVGAVTAAAHPAAHAPPRLHTRPGAGGAARGLRLRIRPAVGRRTSHFVVSFTAQLTGLTFPDSSSYQLVASGGSSRTCRSTQRMSAVPPTTPGQRIHLTLTPSGPSGLWCAGRYTGRLRELFQPVCGPGTICPLMARLHPSLIVVRSLETFHFRVR
jgi:hypothetical protein